MTTYAARTPELSPFFFQAEDGIRDGRVTGVQTCALPIWKARHQDAKLTSPCLVKGPIRKRNKAVAPCFTPGSHPPCGAGYEEAAPVNIASDKRSEERRVGKECRCECGGGGYQNDGRWE